LARKKYRAGYQNIKPFFERKMRVVFGARWDQEKQPQFFMDLATKFKETHPDVEFAICQGGPLRSNNQFYVDEAKHLAKGRHTDNTREL
jgi:hypothetical protein